MGRSRSIPSELPIRSSPTRWVASPTFLRLALMDIRIKDTGMGRGEQGSGAPQYVIERVFAFVQDVLDEPSAFDELPERAP
jgi:hypothetical protein